MAGSQEQSTLVDYAPPCGVDDPRIRTFGLLLEAYSQLTRQLDSDLQDSDGISLQTFEVLLRISRSPMGHITMSELAEGVSLTTGGVTRLADRLEKDGLVERRSCPTDRRVVHLGLTAQGTDTLAVALGHHLESLEQRVASRISAADTEVLERVLDELRRPTD
jgi:MarR family 2-MHQ and catechol resistance regulon transcriptional repressor